MSKIIDTNMASNLFVVSKDGKQYCRICGLECDRVIDCRVCNYPKCVPSKQVFQRIVEIANGNPWCSGIEFNMLEKGDFK